MWKVAQLNSYRAAPGIRPWALHSPFANQAAECWRAIAMSFEKRKIYSIQVRHSPTSETEVNCKLSKYSRRLRPLHKVFDQIMLCFHFAMFWCRKCAQFSSLVKLDHVAIMWLTCYWVACTRCYIITLALPTRIKVSVLGPPVLQVFQQHKFIPK